MILIDDIIISDDVIEKQFVCNLHACKGACCIEGDSGAPLEKEEIKILKKIYPKVKKYLTKEGIESIEKNGVYVDEKDDEYTAFATPLINGSACAYIYYDEKNIASCGIEKAWKAGEINFQKPISCHLYPIRIKQMETVFAVNFDEWEICDDACKLGKKLKIPTYIFVRDALIRKFGQEFYSTLEKAVEEHKNS